MKYEKIPQLRLCEFCGEEFASHHGLQRYCPEKFGKKNFCKNEKKKLVNERKLAELDQDVGSAINQVELDLNIEILDSLLNKSNCIVVSSLTLDIMGYDVQFFSNKKKNEASGHIDLIVGPFVLEWVDKTDQELIFNLKKS